MKARYLIWQCSWSHLVWFVVSFGDLTISSVSHLVSSRGVLTLRRDFPLINKYIKNNFEEEGPSKVGPLLPKKRFKVIAHTGSYQKWLEVGSITRHSNGEDLIAGTSSGGRNFKEKRYSHFRSWGTYQISNPGHILVVLPAERKISSRGGDGKFKYRWYLPF